ncbi:MAG: cytochrome c biogenesis CcdA family protein [Candidatus Kapaibacteriota bacterium]
MESIFELLYNVIYQGAFFGFLASFGWGILSILLSPCHLASISLIIGFITSGGISSLKKAFIVSLIFSLGVLLTLAALGSITIILRRIMGDIGKLGSLITATLFIVVGLYFLGVIKLPFVGKNFKHSSRITILTPFLLGVLFGSALGPCTFAFLAPVLGVVFQTAHTNIGLSVLLLTGFSLGHCSTIIILGTLTAKVQKYLDWSQKAKTANIIKIGSGILVILAGVYLLLNQFAVFNISFF